MSEVTQTQTSETPVNQNRPSGPRGNRREGGKPGSPRRGDRRDFKEIEKEFKEELLEVARVTRVTAGGRQLRFRAAVVIGNGKGTIGLGTGKANEVSVAVEKAVRDAKKNLINFPIVNGTLPHEVTANFKATSVLIHPAAQGTGIIAGGSIRKLAFVSGLQDVIIKRRGGTNALTNVRAALKAFAALKKTGSEFLKSPVVEAPVETKTTEKKTNRKN
jgi:small subunit ribosomal protein S5